MSRIARLRLRSTKPLVAVNISVDGCQEMAGFEVSTNGRFRVSTEENADFDAEAFGVTASADRSVGRSQ